MALGKGLGSLIPQKKENVVKKSVSLAPKTETAIERVWHIPLSEITANPEQPRKHFSHKDLEDLVNEYLAELSDGRFGLQFAVTNDKLNVIISDEGKDIDILALSSGELARVNTSTLLAIRRLMSTLSKSKINALFLDEVIGVLDDEGREKLIEILLKEHELNTFLVSHGWSHPLLSKANVIKTDNISRIEWQ